VLVTVRHAPTLAYNEFRVYRIWEVSVNGDTFVLRGRFIAEGPALDCAIRGGRVVSVRRAGRGAPDVGHDDAVLAPPLFDIQVNGIGGLDLQSPELIPEHVIETTRLLARHGVAHWVPTLITGPLDAMAHACRAIVAAMEDRDVARAVPGIHLEGPFISPENGPRGAHPRAHARPPNIREFGRLYDAARGRVLYATVAPELSGAIPFIRSLSRRGVRVSLGHHNATAAQIDAAVVAGARMSTHLGNGSAPHMPRHENPLWPQLAEDRLAASLIADGHHLPVPVLRTFVRAKGAGRIILVSDCMPFTGLPPGRYACFGAPVELRRDGKVCLVGTELLAGSATPLIEGVAHVAAVTDLSVREAIACATTIPARVMGLRYRFSPPKAGSRANVIAFDLDRPRRLLTVFIDGKRWV